MTHDHILVDHICALVTMTVARSLPPSDYAHQIYMKPPPEYSTRACGSTNASQSDACVGNRPIDWHLYKANAILTNCPKKYTNFCPNAWVPSITLNAEEVRDTMSDFELFHAFFFLNIYSFKHLLCCRVNSALTGLMMSIQTIIMGKIEMELPAIYMIKRFMGTCLRGPNARSQDFLIIRWLESDSLMYSTLWKREPVGVYPGGDGISTLLSCFVL